MLKFELRIKSANAEFESARESLDALARIAEKLAGHSRELARTVVDPAQSPKAWVDSVRDVKGNKVGFFSFLWEEDA